MECPYRRMDTMDRRAELVNTPLDVLKEHLELLLAEMKDLSEDYSEMGVQIYEDACLWRAAYSEEINARLIGKN